ncbi:MAG: AAA family ATPase, partial [Pseudomonadota bacterium]
NDISLYQKLLNLGISNYIVFPVTAPDLITAISDVYAEPGREKIGKITAVVGAKGGVGASAIAHNVALEVAEQSSADVLLVDLDVCFGTATLDLDIEANQGLGEVLDQAERLDAAMLDRVLVKRGEHLCLLGTPPNLETDVTIDEFGIERLLETASSHIPHIVLDLPHLWAPWMRRAMAMADRAVIVGTPEIGCLRNVATLMTQLKSIRPNDQSPVLALNQIGLPGRQELTLREISSVLKVPSLIAIPYDAKTFNRAAASAKMLREVGPRKPVVKAIGEIARAIAPPPERRKKRTRSLWRR